MTDSMKAPSLQPQRMATTEVKRLSYLVDLPAGVPLARVLEPSYFAHVARLMKPGFHIEVLAEDGKFFAELLVRKVEKESVHCWLLHHIDLNAQLVKQPEAEEPTADSMDDYKVEFSKSAHKWRVVRLADHAVIHKGEASEPEARAWLEQYLDEAVTA